MIQIGGAKNASLPLIASTALSPNYYTFENFSLNSDVHAQLKILSQYNISYKISNSNLIIDSRNLKIPDKIDFSYNARGSYYFIASCLNHNKDLFFKVDNGCKIDNRKIDFHLNLLSLYGKEYDWNDGKLVVFNTKNSKKNDNQEYTLPKPSVGATINALLFFCNGNKSLKLYNYAKDPYIFQEIEFLKQIGAEIIVHKNFLHILGKSLNKYKSVSTQIIPDPIESITYIIYATINLLLNQEVCTKYHIGPIIKKDLGLSYQVLQKIGIDLIDTDKLLFYQVAITKKLEPFHIYTDFFPGVYTDVQPFFALLACFIDGTSYIKENIYNKRFEYINNYKLFNIDSKILNNNILCITGSSCKKIANKDAILKNFDLRSDMSTYLLNKISISYSCIDPIYIKRGYYDYEIKTDLIMSNLDIKSKYSTKELSNLNIGGKTNFYTEAVCVDDIKKSVEFAKSQNIPFKIIGSGFNIYFSNFYHGILVKNKIKHHKVTNKKDMVNIEIGSGNSLQELVDLATINNVDIHQFSDIPGTIGASIYGNAGAYGLEIKDFLKSLVVLDTDNYQIKKIISDDIHLTYRGSDLKKNIVPYIIIKAQFSFKKSKDSVETILQRNFDIYTKRRSKMVYNNTLGSIFKNPDNIKIGALLDLLNIKNQVINNILISNNHSNIWINENNASVEDMDCLVEKIQKLIFERYNISIELEIEKI